MKKTRISAFSLGTRATQAGQGPDPSTGAITVPIRETSTYVQQIRAWFSPKHPVAASQDSRVVSSGCHADLEDVRYAYRLLLDREPDEVGFENYKRLIGAGGVTLRTLADNLLGSEEFRAGRKGEGDPVEVDLGGYSMFVRPNDHDIGLPILQSKTYEPHVTAVLRELLKKDNTFVDVGANVGYFMALAAMLVGPNGQVVAVEPMDKNLQLLYATVWRNEFRHVQIHPFAASDKRCVLSIATGGGTSNGQVIVETDAEKVPAMFAQGRPLDDLLASLSELHILKIDIEGHELIALRGFREGLARHRPRIVSEFHPKCMRENSHIDPADYLSFLFDYADGVVALHTDSSRVECAGPADVMREWQMADVRLASQGTTHIDLLVVPRA